MGGHGGTQDLIGAGAEAEVVSLVEAGAGAGVEAEAGAQDVSRAEAEVVSFAGAGAGIGAEAGAGPLCLLQHMQLSRYLSCTSQLVVPRPAWLFPRPPSLALLWPFAP